MNKKLLAGIGSAIGFVALSVGIVWASVALPNPALEPTPTPTAVVSVFELNGLADAPPKPTPEPVVAPEPAPVAPPAPAPEPAYGSYPAGYPVPFIPSSDPEDAAGGYYDTSACASGSGSTGGDGVPYCD